MATVDFRQLFRRTRETPVTADLVQGVPVGIHVSSFVHQIQLTYSFALQIRVWSFKLMIEH